MLECREYRKKPVVIEAVRYTGDNLAEVLAFTGKHPLFDEWFSSFDEYAAHVASDRQVFKILTLEGTMEASPGDWIIKGVKGEFYPCKPDIFEATYEPALSTVTPAEVSDLVDRLREGTFGSDITKTDAYLNGLMREAAIALAAKDAKLAAVHQRYVDANEARIDAEAQLAEARKALDALTGPEADMRDYHEGIVGSLAAKINAYEAAMEPFAKAGELFADPSPDYAHLELIWRPAAGDAYALYADHLRAARRAREGGRDA